MNVVIGQVDERALDLRLEGYDAGSLATCRKFAVAMMDALQQGGCFEFQYLPERDITSVFVVDDPAKIQQVRALLEIQED